MYIQPSKAAQSGGLPAALLRSRRLLYYEFPLLRSGAMLERFSIEMFADRIGEKFRVQAGAAQDLSLELFEVTDLTSRGGPDSARSRAAFSVLFRGPRETVLPQRIYRLEQDAGPTFEIFLVPIGPDREGMRYEAIFT
jgi:hypothetical protein